MRLAPAALAPAAWGWHLLEFFQLCRSARAFPLTAGERMPASACTWGAVPSWGRPGACLAHAAPLWLHALHQLWSDGLQISGQPPMRHFMHPLLRPPTFPRFFPLVPLRLREERFAPPPSIAPSPVHCFGLTQTLSLSALYPSHTSPQPPCSIGPPARAVVISLSAHAGTQGGDNRSCNGKATRRKAVAAGGTDPEGGNSWRQLAPHQAVSM